MSAPNWTPCTVTLGALKPWAANPRLSTKAQAKRILASFAKFGQVLPVAIGPDNEVYDGHQRLSALLTVHGADYEIDARRSSRPLTDEERRALVVTLHAGAVGAWNWDDLAGWDAQALGEWGMNADALKQWNTDAAALAAMLEAEKPAPVDAEPQIDRAEELRAKWGVEPGQLWKLGEHRLICGDCTDAGTVALVMGEDRAAVCLTDPPYGLGGGKESGKNDYDQHDDTHENLVRLADKWLPIARDTAPVVVFSPGVTNSWIYPAADWVMCWFYGGGQLRSSWGYNCWQPFLCYGRDPSLASGHGGRPDAVDMNTPANADDLDHPCPKPLKLWEWFIERLSFDKGDVFYEPFSGSGTTIIACERLGRRCRAVEISPAYVAVALERWAQATGGTPELVEA